MGLLLFRTSSLFLTGIRLKKEFLLSVEANFCAFFEPTDEVIVTTFMLGWKGDTYFLKNLTCLSFETVSSKFYAKDEKNPYDFTHPILQERKSNGTEFIWSIHGFSGVSSAFLVGSQAFRKKRYGFLSSFG